MLPLANFLSHLQTKCRAKLSDKFLLAVSGGKDSVLMAHLFSEAKLSFSIAHCNFKLRGQESDRDEQFVRLLAKDLGVECHVTSFDTKAFAEDHKVSIQMAARQLRYQWFNELKKNYSFDAIALAQHQTDAVETVLLNLTRGTGISGLHGILSKRGAYIRPLLFLSSADVATLINDAELSFVEDSSNASDKYARNNIRLNVLPHLRDINPNLEQTFAGNIHRFAQTELVLQQVVDGLREKLLNVFDGHTYIKIADVKGLQPAHLLLYELLKDFNFSYDVVGDLLRSIDHQSGLQFLSATHQLVINRDELLISPLATENNSRVLWQRDNSAVQFNGHQLQVEVVDSATISGLTSHAYVDASLLIYPLVVRFWQQGDRFRPLGMLGFKKLSDFFINQKIALPLKTKIPIVVNGNGDMIWIVGLRQDDRYKVTPATQKVAVFECIDS